MIAKRRLLVCLGLLAVSGVILFVQRGSSIPRQTAPNAQAKGTTDASGVMYFSHEDIVPAFTKPLDVYDGVPNQRNYRVAVYHRDKGGEVEIHKKDTDVFYILDGEATFVTGGTVSGGRETAPDEIRVATMDGGVTRKIGKGDVIVIPVGVTHWFKEVEKPVTYFGVKVR